MYSMIATISSALCYKEVLEGVNPEFSSEDKNFVFYFVSI